MKRLCDACGSRATLEHVYRTGSMPAPGFYLYCARCADVTCSTPYAAGLVVLFDEWRPIAPRKDGAR